MLTPRKLALARSLGPVVIDIAGTALTEREIRMLEHPMTGAVILFTRNFTSTRQLRALTGAIRAIRPGILITVDHEGGRVQRFREGFTAIPAMADIRGLGADAPAAFAAAGFLLASELRACGIGMSFTPVLDLDYGRSGVIGNRSLGRTLDEAERNARALISGLRAAGMASCGKHFPGHGWAEADSHVAMPADDRPCKAVMQDLVLYQRLATELESIMTAHVAYAGFGGATATYCPELLGYVLRDEVGFTGLVFSDDLSMKGAGADDLPAGRAESALDSGCDMVLHCNHPDECAEILDALAGTWHATDDFCERLGRLLPDDDSDTMLTPEELRKTARWRAAREVLEKHRLI